MSETTHTAVAGPVEPTVRPQLPDLDVPLFEAVERSVLQPTNFALWQPAVDSPLERDVRPRSVEALLRTMDRAGWALDWVDLDMTGRAPRVEIRATRYDGLWVRAYVDQLGRATIERFQRERSLGVPRNKKAGARMPMAPMIDDHFMGRQRYEGGRSMMRGLCAYLTDNALHPVALADMRSAWAALMQAPARIAGPNA